MGKQGVFFVQRGVSLVHVGFVLGVFQGDFRIPMGFFFTNGDVVLFLFRVLGIFVLHCK